MGEEGGRGNRGDTSAAVIKINFILFCTRRPYSSLVDERDELFRRRALGNRNEILVCGSDGVRCCLLAPLDVCAVMRLYGN